MFVVVFAICMLAVGAVVSIFMPYLPSYLSVILPYFCSMIAVYGAVLYIENKAFKHVLPIYADKGGFDPVTLLWGVMLIMAVSVVLLPLDSVLPPDNRTFASDPCTLITVVIFAPIFEELIFRGRLYNILSRNTSPLMSSSLCAVAFGVVHMQPIVVIEALVVGVVLSYFYLSKRSIFTPIILHMFNNAVGYALIVLSYDGESLRQLVGRSASAHIGIYLLCLLIVVVGAVFIIRFFVMEKQRSRGIECQDMETIANHFDDEDI
jgi:membrane protease YdiL (CAAX protease family)